MFGPLLFSCSLTFGLAYFCFFPSTKKLPQRLRFMLSFTQAGLQGIASELTFFVYDIFRGTAASVPVFIACVLIQLVWGLFMTPLTLWIHRDAVRVKEVSDES